MDWRGLIPLALGLALITLGVNGKYRQAWQTLTGSGSAPATRTA